MKLKRNDIFLCVIIAILILLSFSAYKFLHLEKGDLIQISVDSEVIKTLPLDKNTTYTIKSSANDNKGTNILEIKDGYALVKEANCPDKLCVHQKKISKAGETLVCLPHKVVISVISSEKTKLDGVAQ